MALSLEVVPPSGHHTGDSFHDNSRFFQEPKLQELSDEDDIEHFLITYKRIAVACRWLKSDWAFHLIPLLTGKARSAYVHINVDKSTDYDHVKSATLQKYNTNKETHRQWFRSLHVEPDETPKELYVRLKEFYGKKLLKLLYLNSTYNCCPQNFRFGSRTVTQKLQKRLPPWLMYLWLLEGKTSHRHAKTGKRTVRDQRPSKAENQPVWVRNPHIVMFQRFQNRCLLFVWTGGAHEPLCPQNTVKLS